jgi:hypothetical protein
MAVGEDLNGGGGARREGAGTQREPRRRAHGWHGPRQWRWHNVKAHVKEQLMRRQRGGGRRGIEAHAVEERSVRHRHGGGRRGIEAHAEEERSARHRCGGDQRGVEADAEEWAPMGV